jgi:hypothetical protein
MFWEPRINVIESDEGYSVETLGRTGMKYSRGDYYVYVDSEICTSKQIILYKNSIRIWDRREDKEAVSEEERNKIANDIIRAFEYKNINVAII